MENKRKSGILMHISSLPSKYGIGDFGKSAFEFVDFLKESKQTLWQVLPLGPTGYGDSPYACFSSFAGNPLFISLDTLNDFGFLDKEDLQTPYGYENKEFIDYGWVINWKMPILKKAALNFLKHNEKDEGFVKFCNQEAYWLDDFALFMSIKEHFYQKSLKANYKDIVMWNTYWDKDIKLKKPKAMEKYQDLLSQDILANKALQYFFLTQWLHLKEYANKNNIEIIGDMPIFVALDSSDAWSNQNMFDINEKGEPNFVAGVPPDYFSSTGQLWGNPLYKWDVMEKDKFSWWIKRIKHSLVLFDIVRIDHFRGFDAFWQIPYGQKTAQNGKWVKAPGRKLFEQIKKEFPYDIPIIAEDLGVITPEVEALRDDFNLPGMKVMQFAFESGEDSGSDRDNLFLPHNYPKNSIAYSGTHDNDTTLGWMRSAKEKDLNFCLQYTNSKEVSSWSIIRSLMNSVADTVVFPIQDILDLDTKYRMNTPSTLGINWMYKFNTNMIFDYGKRLRELSFIYSRNINQD